MAGAGVRFNYLAHGGSPGFPHRGACWAGGGGARTTDGGGGAWTTGGGGGAWKTGAGGGA